MSFQPVLPVSGYAGWRFLERTLDTQRAVFNDSTPMQRASDAFRERIGAIETADDLVADRALLAVALGAFGLDDDLNNTFFIRKILEGSASNPDALMNRLSDNRYADFSKAFGFGEVVPPRTGLSFFADEIIERYEAKQFEQAVGAQNNDMRLALNLAPALNDVIAGNETDAARWFSMMGNAPLRSLFETAFGFPQSFGSVDIDLQLDQFRRRAQATFGTSEIGDLASPEHQEKLIRLYMIRSEAASFSPSGASVALTLLQQVQSPYA